MNKSTMFFLWLGASIAISEIFTGGLVASLGLVKGGAAIISGHLIGSALLALGGHVAFTRRENAMESVVWSFGRSGGALIALCNVVQLIGWTVVMIVQASSALVGVADSFSFGGSFFAFMPVAFVMSVLVCLWALIFGSRVEKLNNIAVVLVSALCVALFVEATGRRGAAPNVSEIMSVSLAVELSIAMPVSWLPLIGDYSSRAADKAGASLVPFAAYFLGSTLMYLLGLFIAVRSGEDIFAFIASSRFPLTACGIILLSTLTTAFLDLYSAAVSSRAVIRVKNERFSILAIGVFSGLVSVLFPAERYGAFLEEFLTSIGMVFIPIYAILFLDFLLGKGKCSKRFHAPNLALAVVGMAGYWLLGRYEVWIPTLATIFGVSALYWIVSKKS
ncbi:hydroxymethylpyrimidine permease [Synergistales bacterium]|nr:hydroxymethylpyrimidine permease [Synergistales bacterium]